MLLKIGLTYCEDSMKDANILVTNKISRSRKFIIAMNKGIPIVNDNWLTDSLSSRTIMHPFEYIIKVKNLQLMFSKKIVKKKKK